MVEEPTKQVIKWSETPDKDKVRMIIKDVMVWPYHEPWEAMSEQYRFNSKPVYPVAFWNDQINKWSVFYQDKENGVCFDPLHDLNDAWRIAEKIRETNAVELGATASTISYPEQYQFHILQGHDPRIWAMSTTPMEAICMAALRFKGYEIVLSCGKQEEYGTT